MARIERGEVWLVNLSPTIGREIRKTRPAVIISNDINNHHAGTVTVLPVTDQGEKIYPFEVAIGTEEAGLVKQSKILCQQIRTIDKGRLVKLLGRLSNEALNKVNKAILVHLGIES